MRPDRGFTLIEIMIVIAILAVLVAITVPSVLEARRSGRESSARSAMRSLSTAQEMFHRRDFDQDGELDYATSLQELFAAKLIDDVLASGTKDGYQFEILPGATAYTWSARSDPTVPGTSGSLYYFVDQSGVIRYSTTGSADASDPAIGE